MKDQALFIARKASNKHQAKNDLREYLQHVLLRILFESQFNSEVVFHGGTALRIIHGLRRFSEDIDCHLISPRSTFDFAFLLQGMIRELQLNNYHVRTSKKLTGPVVNVFFKFEELLYEAGLSPHRTAQLSVKFEIDTNPPAGFEVETSFVNQYFPFTVKHHDRSTFLAGKIHAIFQRPYTKGRDFFDLLFFLSRWRNVTPNFRYLNAALKQTQYIGPTFNNANWRNLLRDRISELNWETIRRDVGPFVENATDLKLLEEKHFLMLLA